MDLNSPLFDRIRVKQPELDRETVAEAPRCDHPGCENPGLHRAPMGRDREGQYFCFCLDHVREYNATYNYFKGMTDDDVARYQRDATIGHRPTWRMGVNRAGRDFREEGVDPSASFRDFGQRAGYWARRTRPEPRGPRYSASVMKALAVLGLDDGADAPMVKARYKELVKRLHPDANGGDRSREEKLREIIQAYNYLKSAKLA